MSDPLQEHITGLQDILTDLRVEEEGIRRQLLGHQDKMRRISRALDILTERERKTAKKAKPPHEWQPRPENVEKVYGAVRDGHQTPAEMAQAVELSRSTVQKALDVLRADERVRKTGTTRAGHSNQKTTTYALMPQAVNDAA